MTAFGDRRVIAAVALAAGVTLGLAGCGAGQISQTAVQYPAINGNSADGNGVGLRNVHVLYPNSAEYTNKAGGKAVLAFVAVNETASRSDKIEKITTENATVKITPSNRTELPAGRSLVAGTKAAEAPTDQLQAVEDPESDPILVELTDLKQDVRPGLTFPVTFTFEKAGDVTVQVPVDAGDSTRHESDKSGKSEGTEHDSSLNDSGSDSQPAENASEGGN